MRILKWAHKILEISKIFAFLANYEKFNNSAKNGAGRLFLGQNEDLMDTKGVKGLDF